MTLHFARNRYCMRREATKTSEVSVVASQLFGLGQSLNETFGLSRDLSSAAL